MVSYARIDFDIQKEVIFLNINAKNEIFKEPGDCLLIKNYKLKWKEILIDRNNHSWDIVDKDFKNAQSYEVLEIKNKIFYHTELNNYHFPFVKKHRRLNLQNNWLSIDQFINKYPKLLQTRINKNMLNEDKIINIYIISFIFKY